MIKKRNFLVALFVATAALFTACSDDDDGTPPVIAPTGSIVVEDQNLMDGMLTISNVVISDDGWLVLYRDNAGVQGTEILGSSHIEAGTHEDVTVELDEGVELTTGETVWVALHVDDDDDGVLDWNGTSGTDVPIRSGTLNVAESFTVTIESNSVTAEDQAIADDNSITISNVTLEENGWIVVHNEVDGAPGEVIGVSDLIVAGSHDDVKVILDESATVNVGDILWVMLHTDTGTAGLYEFDGVNGFDLPVLNDDDTPVMISVTVTE